MRSSLRICSLIASAAMACCLLFLSPSSGAQATEQAPLEISNSPRARATDRAIQTEASQPADHAKTPLSEDRAKRTESLLSEANAAYQAGDYARAIELYPIVLERGIRNGDLYYNLGNAHHRSQHTGEAILNYRRAQLYLPRDGDVLANLAYARKNARDKIENDEESWAGRIFFWHASLSDFELIWSCIILNVIFWTLLLARGGRSHPALRWAIFISGMGTLLSGSTAAARAWDYARSPDGVVLIEQLSVRSGTDVNSVPLFVLHEGAEVHTRSNSGDWIQIELPDKKRGWVEKKFLGLVVP